MRGNVLFFEQHSHSGKISGIDGKHYNFVTASWKSPQLPQAGMEVDFVFDGETATEIFLIKSTSTKSRAVYIILAIFFGGLGVHNFYAGYKNKGVWQLVLCLVSIPLSFVIVGFFTGLALLIWVIVDIVTINKDSDGNLFS